MARTSMIGRACGLLGCVMMVAASPAAAQTFYKWTDNRGVVHLSDLPPSRGQEVEERHLRVPPVVTRPESEDGEEAAADSDPEASAAAGDGPARVVMVSRKTPRTGPSMMHITGEVKNVGGKDAESVVVAVTALDSVQGNPCLDEEADVTPATLRPGQSGSFDLNLDSPCLFGNAKVDLQPVWE
jgi:hypothetical protein